MPKIVTYEQTTDSSFGNSTPRAQGEQFSGSVGNAMQNLAQVGQQIIDQHDEEIAKSWVLKSTTDSALKWHEYSIAKQEQANADGSAAGYAPQMQAEMEKYNNDLIASAPNKRAREMIQPTLQNQLVGHVTQAMQFEAESNVKARTNEYTEAVEKMKLMVVQGLNTPSEAKEYLKKLMPNVGTDMAIRLKKLTEEGLTAAGLERDLAANPGDLYNKISRRLFGDAKDMAPDMVKSVAPELSGDKTFNSAAEKVGLNQHDGLIALAIFGQESNNGKSKASV
jgi:hypothetical protein